MSDLQAMYHATKAYLQERLIPFWAQRIVEPQFGGFQTNYDRDGQRTAVTEKTLLAQGRTLFTIAHAVRCRFAWPGWEGQLSQGIAFLQDHFRDPVYDGYYWIVDEQGQPLDDSKVLYGHSFLIYGLAEVALLTGHQGARQTAEHIFDLVQERAADSEYGGYIEHFDRTFQPKQARGDVALFKSLDVHMHLMEAFTALYELTGDPAHRQALEQVSELIFARMVDPQSGTGIAMFTRDWTPIANVELDTVWGSDRFEREKATDITSYGHNIELAWLYLHTLEVLGQPLASALGRVEPIFRHTAERGVDWRYGGLFVEGHRNGGATEDNKEFWQQAEALVGFAEAYSLTREPRYLEALQNIHTFVWGKVINWEQGEWFPLLDRQGNVLWDYMGHNWKICYHTVRAMCELVRRLEAIPAPRGQAGSSDLLP
jgi:mannobiose 2-epimerase